MKEEKKFASEREALTYFQNLKVGDSAPWDVVNPWTGEIYLFANTPKKELPEWKWKSLWADIERRQ